MDAVALMCGLVWTNIAALVELGITAGYLDPDEASGVGLSAKGQRWYERDLPLRD